MLSLGFLVMFLWYKGNWNRMLWSFCFHTVFGARDIVLCSKRNSVTDTLIITVQNFCSTGKGVIKHLAV